MILFMIHLDPYIEDFWYVFIVHACVFHSIRPIFISHQYNTSKIWCVSQQSRWQRTLSEARAYAMDVRLDHLEVPFWLNLS